MSYAHVSAQESGNVLTPNVCGNVFSETNGNPSKEDEERLVWATSAIMGGGMDTVSYFLASKFCAIEAFVGLEHVYCSDILHCHDTQP